MNTSNKKNKYNNQSTKRDLINNKIPFKTLTVIDNNGVNQGVMSLKDALNVSSSLSLDLVLISVNKDNPVAKIVDYGKYNYQKKQKIKQAKKNQSMVKTKAIKVKTQISNHDLMWKADQAKEWLTEGYRVQFVIKAYGRVSTKIDLIYNTYNRFTDLVKDHGSVVIELKKLNPMLYQAYYQPLKSSSKKTSITKDNVVNVVNLIKHENNLNNYESQNEN